MDNNIGKVLGNRYLLKEVIGVGGMAVVYKAIDNIDNKTVAVKILKEEHKANDEFRRRFKNESKAIAVLSHPNIVKVYDVSFGENVQYIVMEHIEGITLKQYIQQKGVLDWREAVLFTSQILRALQHAHEKGIIHRDIKPQNIMLLNDNKTIKVADFGIARFNNMSDTKTMSEGAIGSVHYISPEQAKGELVDNRTDIYSCGVVLYEMITGQLPFRSDSAVSVAIMQLQKQAVAPRKLNPSIPAGIEQITMKAMQKRAADRYQAAAEMLLDIDELRRNPNKKFEYDFSSTVYGAHQPRRTSSFASGAPVAKSEPTYTKATVITQEPDEYDYELEEISRKNYTLPILVGIIFALVVVIIGIAWFFFTNTDEVTVPEFEGKLIEEIREDDDYKYFFDHGFIEENLVYTTEYEEGYIFYQSEEAGKKVQITNTSSFIIKLNIAYTSESMTVPTLDKSAKLQDARSILQKMGFKIKTEGVVDNTVPESTVLRMEPAAGTSVAYGSTVTIFYAIDDAGKIAVPNVTGLTLAKAKQELNSIGLKVAVEYEEAPASKAGLVLEQSIAPDTTVVASKTQITIVVGTTSKKTTSVTITLPPLQDYDEIYESVYVYVGETLYKTYTSVKLDGTTHTVEIGGTDDTTFAIFIGEQEICSGKVNFTLSTPAVTDKKVTQYKHEGMPTTAAPTTKKPDVVTTTSPYCTVPSFSGKHYLDYYDELLDAGFDNIDIIDIASDTVTEGNVVSVSSEKSTYSRDEAMNALIKVYVSTGLES
ncbi:MAG: Stk1 family PASTA domain-containing Ser/Thr kinase [Clostridia bacterium]|nr:Stk1 family PASTA domain-containing Ser/Thr kinase [Clostridia bacterium]